MLRETENDDLTSVMQKIVCTYVEEVTPLAVEITSHLAQTFAKVLETESEGGDEKAIAAMGILNTLETIVNVMEDQKEVCMVNIKLKTVNKFFSCCCSVSKFYLLQVRGPISSGSRLVKPMLL